MPSRRVVGTSAVLLFLTVGLAVALSACQFGGRATVTLHLQNSSAQGATVASLAPSAGGARATLQPASIGDRVQSFTPTSLQVPVLQITLMDSGSGAATQLYACDPTTDPNACRVDFAQNLSAFQDLINTTAQAAAGTYDTVQMVTCTHGSGGSSTSNPIDYTAKVSGQALIGTTTYVTDPSQTSPNGLVSAVASGAAPSPKAVTVGFSGCARDYRLPAPVTLTDGQSFTLSLYVDLADIAWIDANPAQMGQTWLPSGCARDDSGSAPAMPQGPFVCLGYPDLAAAPGATAPVLKRYLVVDGTSVPTLPRSGAIFGIYFDAANRPLSGYTRFLFEQAPVALGFMPGTPFKTISLNADGATLSVESFGSSATGPGYFTASDFPIAGGAGQYTTSNPGSACSSGGPCPYDAKLLP